MDFIKKNKWQVGLIALISLGVFTSVFLSQQIQTLISKAADGLSWTDFVESFGSGSDEARYNKDFDINLDGRINIFDILFARRDSIKVKESTDSADATTSATQ